MPDSTWLCITCSQKAGVRARGDTDSVMNEYSSCWDHGSILVLPAIGSALGANCIATSLSISVSRLSRALVPGNDSCLSSMSAYVLRNASEVILFIKTVSSSSLFQASSQRSSPRFTARHLSRLGHHICLTRTLSASITSPNSQNDTPRIHQRAAKLYNACN